VGKWKHSSFRALSRVKWCVVFNIFSMSIKTECILHVKYMMRVFVTCCWLCHSSYTYVLASVKDPFVVNKLALGKVFVQEFQFSCYQLSFSRLSLHIVVRPS